MEPYLERSQVVHSHPSGGSSGTVIPAEACKPTFHKYQVYFVYRNMAAVLRIRIRDQELDPGFGIF
jgi:hypothetical protein